MIGSLPPLLLLLGLPTARAADLIEAWDFESNDGGFVSGGDLPQWEWGTATSGPDSAFSGTRLWGTDLDGMYLRENELTLTLPAGSLAGIDAPVLVLQHWLDLADGDSALIEVDEGAGFTSLDPVYGYDGDGSFSSTDDRWQPVYVDLAGLDDTDQLRLVLTSAEGRAMGWYVDDVQLWSGDAVPPRVADVVAPTQWSRFDEGPTIEAWIQDDLSLSSIAVVWSTDSIAETRTGFATLGDDRWTATLPAVPPGALRWHIEASDGDNLTLFPADSDEEMRVFLPAPQDLSGPDGHSWGSTIDLSWTAPDSEETVVSYLVYRDDSLLFEIDETQAQVPAAGPVDVLSVSALYTTQLGDFEGDASDAINVDVAVPQFSGLNPATAYQGDVLRLELTGRDLLLAAVDVGTAALDLGPGVTVSDVDVEHVDAAVFTVAVDETADVGWRDATLELRDESLLLEDAFEVVSGDARPALLSLEPQALEQGESATVVLELSVAPAGLPTVDLGEGVVVESTTVDGAFVSVEVAVANDADLGAREVLVDDGVRILTLSDGFRVWARTVQLDKKCAAAPSSSRLGLWMLALVLLPLRRRRRT